MKYWNRARIVRRREGERRSEERRYARVKREALRARTYMKGDMHKNAVLMMNILGKERHRRMLVWLRKGGAMSVSKFAKPFRLSLASAMRYVHLFERSGLISTHKRGRIRFCVFRPGALEELAAYLRAPHPFE